MVGQLTVRAAGRGDAERIAAIYNAGIEGRGATFQTTPRAAADIEAWLAERGPLLVAETEDDGVIGWARVTAYADSCVYGGVGEYTIYLDPAAQGRGAGRQLLDALCEQAERAGLYKLVGKLFSTNEPSLRLALRCGFAEVGVHVRHGRLDGVWKDVVVVERLLGEGADRPGGDLPCVKDLPLASPALASCSLTADGMAEQGRRYAELGHHVRDVVREPRALVAQFDEGVDLALLEQTVTVERGCCSFFDIEIQGLRLRIGVAEDLHIPALDAIAEALGA